jgi:putative transposase
VLCALESTKEAYAFTVFERTFKEFGVPRAIRTDNGVPFASRGAFFGLSQIVGMVATTEHPHRAHQAW